MIQPKDLVIVTFSDGHTQEGTVVSIDREQEYGYIVNIKVYGKDSLIYCRESDLKLIPRESL